MSVVVDIDDILVPDPGPDDFAGDRWYRDVTTERALAAAERRHTADLRRRYVDSREWADYSVQDLRLPMTTRQCNTAAAALIVSLIITLVGIIVGSAVTTFAPLLLTAPTLALVIRDLYRRAALWLVQQ